VNEQSLGDYLNVVRRRKWWLIVTTVLVVGATLAISFVQPKRYSASAQVLVQSPLTFQSGVMATAGTITPVQIATYAQLATSPPVEAAVAKDLGVHPAPPVTVTAVANTNLISITASNRSPDRAAPIANAYGTEFAAHLRQQVVTQTNNQIQSLRNELVTISSQLTYLQASKNPSDNPQISYLTSQQVVLGQNLAVMIANQKNVTGVIQVVSTATRPTTPSSPKPFRNGLISLAGGLILGLALVLGVDYFDDRLLSRQDIDRASRHLPVLAFIPLVKEWRTRENTVLVSRTEPTSPSAEAFWSLRSAIQFAAPDHPIRTILITSPAPGEGKTATVANLGTVMAAGGQRTLVVSSDIRRPRLGRFFGIDRRSGLTSVLIGDATLDDAVQQVEGVENLWFLDAGPLPPDPHQILASAAAGKMFDTLKRHFHYVLIDSPPLLAVADSLDLARLADATLVVAAVGQTKKRDLRRSLELLDTVRTPILGMVLNEVTSSSAAYGYGYHYYAYGQLDESRGQSADSGKSAANFTLSSHVALHSRQNVSNGDSTEGELTEVQSTES